jgi:Arc/MetJ-type ribon-helix-helix transcriptional regulator
MVSKVSISLNDDDVAYLDGQSLSGRFASRSAAVQAAIRLLRESELADAYAEAYGSWDESDEAATWDAAAADGLTA